VLLQGFVGERLVDLELVTALVALVDVGGHLDLSEEAAGHELALDRRDC
jgi:hypothetical protein